MNTIVSYYLLTIVYTMHNTATGIRVHSTIVYTRDVNDAETIGF